MEYEDDTVDKLSIDSIPHIFNTASFLEIKKWQTVERYQFLMDAAKNGTGRCQILAAKFMLQFFDVFPEKQFEAAKVVLALMNINEENGAFNSYRAFILIYCFQLRLTLLKDLYIIGIKGVYHKQAIELYLNCTVSNLEEERILAYDGLVQFLHHHWLDVAGIIRELLNKEHSAKNRKQILEFLNDRMRIIPFTLLKDEEVLKTLENIFKEEFARANLSYVDNLFMYLGNSILMDKYERQQSIAKYFVESQTVPSHIPDYIDEPATITAKVASVNAELDSILVQMTILHQMTTIMRDKSDTLNEWFSFFVDNINKIFDLPFEREMRALRAFAQFTCSCTNMVSDDHVDKLALIIMKLVPSIDAEAETVTLPKIDLHRLEPCILALYNLRHTNYFKDAMDETTFMHGEFRKRLRFLVRYCQLKSTEYKRTVEELGDVPLRKEMNALVAAASSVGLIAIEIVKPSESWELKPRPSWKTCSVIKTTPRKPKRLNHQLKLTAPVINIS
uniref:Uncharacterized protein n=1 Tax=Pristionchus pacificus TaxID=54126 RepID=A0A454XI53_PRIPA|eukprot:PDM83933.1 hypothetical protein PRIPAC_34125 [Pristionchus pacificus]